MQWRPAILIALALVVQLLTGPASAQQLQGQSQQQTQPMLASPQPQQQQQPTYVVPATQRPIYAVPLQPVVAAVPVQPLQPQPQMQPQQPQQWATPTVAQPQPQQTTMQQPQQQQQQQPSQLAQPAWQQPQWQQPQAQPVSAPLPVAAPLRRTPPPQQQHPQQQRPAQAQPRPQLTPLQQQQRSALKARQQKQQARKHEREAALSDEIQLTCPVASQCGITSSTPFVEAVYRHTDLSVCASHATFLPFMAPLVDVLSRRGNITAVFPAAAAMMRLQQYEVDRFCSKRSSYYSSDACRAMTALVKVDRVMVENAVDLANRGEQKIQYAQWSATHGHALLRAHAYC
jgi:hypothetical protein